MIGRGCVFLDRDGVINESPEPGAYILSWSEFRLVEAIVDWIRLFNTLGYLVIVVTNQRGVARGLMTQEDVESIHRKMVELLGEKGARLDDVLYCPHEEGCCDCRKPRTGMVRQAQDKWGIDLKKSIMIGDSERDRCLAEAAGLEFVRVDRGRIVEISFPTRDSPP